jgi:hypothetical protein
MTTATIHHPEIAIETRAIERATALLAHAEAAAAAAAAEAEHSRAYAAQCRAKVDQIKAELADAQRRLTAAKLVVAQHE